MIIARNSNGVTTGVTAAGIDRNVTSVSHATRHARCYRPDPINRSVKSARHVPKRTVSVYVSKWTPERLGQLAEEFEAFKNMYQSRYADPETDGGKAALGQLGASLAMVRDVREKAQRDSTLAVMANQTKQRMSGGRS